MKKVFRSRVRVVFFCRWSRSGWALFASRGKQVHIGEIDATICEQAYAKTCSTGHAISLLYRAPGKNFLILNRDGYPCTAWFLVLVRVVLSRLVTMVENTTGTLFDLTYHNNATSAVPRGFCAFLFLYT